MSVRVVSILEKQFPDAILETHAQHGDETVVVESGAWLEVCEFLKENQRTSMEMLTDLTAVDFPDRAPRFEVVAHFYSLTKGHRLRLKARTGDADGQNAAVASIQGLWACANWIRIRGTRSRAATRWVRRSAARCATSRPTARSWSWKRASTE